MVPVAAFQNDNAKQNKQIVPGSNPWDTVQDLYLCSS